MVFALEASTESPGADREFARFAGEGFDVMIDTSRHGAPDELHLAGQGPGVASGSGPIGTGTRSAGTDQVRMREPAPS